MLVLSGEQICFPCFVSSVASVPHHQALVVCPFLASDWHGKMGDFWVRSMKRLLRLTAQTEELASLKSPCCFSCNLSCILWPIPGHRRLSEAI